MADDGVTAYAYQGQGAYQGSDYWQEGKLNPGEKLVQLDYARPNATTKTASQFFTTYEELQKHIDPETGKVDTAALSERLQVGAHTGRGRALS